MSSSFAEVSVLYSCIVLLFLFCRICGEIHIQAGAIIFCYPQASKQTCSMFIIYQYSIFTFSLNLYSLARRKRIRVGVFIGQRSNIQTPSSNSLSQNVLTVCIQCFDLMHKPRYLKCLQLLLCGKLNILGDMRDKPKSIQRPKISIVRTYLLSFPY